MYEAEIEKPKNYIFEGNLDELNKQSKKDLLEYGQELTEQEQKKL